MAACAFALDKQLKRVDLPTFGKPTIPAFNAIFSLVAFYVRALPSMREKTKLFVRIIFFDAKLVNLYDKMKVARRLFHLLG